MKYKSLTLESEQMKELNLPCLLTFELFIIVYNHLKFCFVKIIRWVKILYN